MDESLIKKLEEIQEALNVLEVELSSGEISQDPNLLADKAKKHSELSEISTLFKEWRKLSKDISEAKVMLEEEEDDEMIKDLNLLLDESIIKSDEIVSQIKVSLLPKDPLDEKDVLVEIRPGTGGEEASIWVSDLFKMYTRYSERMDWKFETLEMIPSDMGGYSKVVFAIKSKGAYSKLKYEANHDYCGI